MRTVVDGRGCNTAPGPTGLSVEGDLVVGEVNVVKALRELSAPKTADSSGVNALKAVSDLSQKLSDLEKGLKKTLSETQAELEQTKKELKTSQEDSKRLVDRVKALETELKKLSKSGKKDTSDTTESA